VIAVEEAGAGGTRLILNLEQNDAARQYWPYSSELRMCVSLGAALEIELNTRNTGMTPIIIGEALHTYFEVSDAREITVHGLDGCEYIDKVDDGKRKRQLGPVTFSGETDRVYLDTVDDCLIDDPGLNRRIRISKQGSRSTVIWNPWREKAAKMGDLGEEGYLNMVCVESANAADNVVSIAAGNEHRLRVTYRLEPLPNRHS
jgi:glucose-6-phosphate 1-epimerase